MQSGSRPSEDLSMDHTSPRENVTTSNRANDLHPSDEANAHLLASENHQIPSDRVVAEAVPPQASHTQIQQQSTFDLNQHDVLLNDNTWLPLGLRSGFLIFLSAVAFSTAAVCTGLLVYSSSNYGLGTDDESLPLSFAWRFLPTLVSVLYVVGISIVFNDVNRTEVFARLSHPTLSDPRWTLCRTPGAWWTTIGETLSRTRNGQRINWVLFFATTVYILGFLAISPLSSSFLDSVTIAVNSTSLFTQPDVLHQGGLPFKANQDAYLRTTAHQLQNLTTSAWINDEYTILPFGPTESASIQIGPTIANSPVQWKASAMVFKAEMTCDAMPVVRIQSNVRASNSTSTYNAMTFSDGRGCSLTFSDAKVSVRSFSYGVGSWFIAPDYLDAWANDATLAESIHSGITDSCRDREIILAISSWPLSHKVNSTTLPSNDSLATCYVCDTRFYIANSSVTMNTDTRGTSTISIDADDFARSRTVIQPSFLNTTLFQRTVISANWTSILEKPSQFASSPLTGGPLRLLSGMYNFDMKQMILDSDLTSKANKFKQRFLGETILAAFADISKMNHTNVMAEVSVEKQRIVVSIGVAVALIVLLFLSGVQILFILFATRLAQRPLHVDQDPSSLAGFTALLLHEKSTRRLFYRTEQATSGDLVSMLSDTRHQLTENGLYSIGRLRPVPTQSKKKRDDWRPLATKRRNGLGLLLYLTILIGGVAAFWAVYLRSGLHGPAFSYEGRVTINSSTFVLAPYSMVPTLLAVLLGLWWGDIVQTFQRVQPYVEMAKRPTSMSSGPQLTYASSYVMFGAFKAARKKHWILALLFLGSVFTEVFTVSMSAIWRRKPIVVSEQIALTPQFDLRTSPQIYWFEAPEIGSPFWIPADTLSALYSSLNTNWMYSALLQLVFNASEPPWSKSGWSFTPLDLSAIDNVTAVTQNTQSLTDARLFLDQSTINVTMRTSAIRARLDCSAYNGASNISSWLTQWDLTNGTQWNLTANPSDLKTGYQLGFVGQMTTVSSQTKPNWNNVLQLKSGNMSAGFPVLNYGSPLQCCPNTSAGINQPMAAGYWTYQWPLYEDATNFKSSFNQRSSTQGDNITTKLIYGYPQQQLYQRNSTFKDIFAWDMVGGDLIWRDVPKITALNCQPIIEFADADVTVDRSSEMVQSFQILSTPQTIEHDAWNASYTRVNYTDNFYRGKHANYASSYGVLFQDALVLASDLLHIGGLGSGGYTGKETLDDSTFNYRTPGLNMDYMTYAMHSLTGKEDLTALLDPAVQARLASLVYGTFFQHFVSSNVTRNGSWTYVPVGTNKFDPNLRPYNHSAYPKYDRVTATVSRRIEGLEMSLTATSLCLGVLGFLILTTIVVYLIDFRHFDRLRHDVRTMADVIRLVYDSPKFLAWVADESRARNNRTNHRSTTRSRTATPNRRGGWRRFWKPDPYQALAQEREKRQEPKVRLGTFIGTDDKRKWIVEIDD